MAQKKTQDTPKPKVARKPRAVKAGTKATTAPKAAKVTKPVTAVPIIKTTKRMPSAGTTFDVIPANRVIPSPSARPVIVPSMPAQADNTLLPAKPARKKAAAKKPAATAGLASKRKMAAAPLDISSGGDVLLEDIAASLSKLQPVPENVVKPNSADEDRDGGTQITVKTGRTMAGSPASATPTSSVTSATLAVSPVSAGPTVGDLLSAQSRSTVDTLPTAPPVKQVVGEKRIMPLVGSEKADAAAGVPDVDEASKSGDSADLKASVTEESKKKVPQKPSPRPAGQTVDGIKSNKPASDGDRNDERKQDDQDHGRDQPARPKESMSEVLDGLDLSQDKHQASDSDDPLNLKGAIKTGKTQATDAQPASTGELYGGSSVILIHEAHPGRTVFKYFAWFMLLLLIALIALNFLLDAGVVSTSYDIPHTDVLQPMEPSPAEMPQ